MFKPAWVCVCSALKRVLDMPTLVLHGDSDVALGEELLDGIEAAVPDVSKGAGPALQGPLLNAAGPAVAASACRHVVCIVVVSQHDTA
jgi:hypothetical protein